MRLFTIWVLAVALVSASALAEPPRFIIDDDAYVEKVTRAGARLLTAGQLVPAGKLLGQIERKRFRVKTVPLAQEKLTPPNLYDRLRERVLAVGAFYKCPECPDWHFNGSTGFVVAEDGIVSTCCHVVMSQDDEIEESYLIAADASGRVFPVQAVLAEDLDSDTCFVKIGAAGLKPLPLRTGARTGERVYCLSHPAGNHFLFTEGMVARVTRTRNERLDDKGSTNAGLTRPILFLNVTTEYAPGSSGAPIVDEAGNVVAQVASLADAGEPDAESTDEQAPASPSVPLRFCIATEEILRLVEKGPETPGRVLSPKTPSKAATRPQTGGSADHVTK